MLSQV